MNVAVAIVPLRMNLMRRLAAADLKRRFQGDGPYWLLRGTSIQAPELFNRIAMNKLELKVPPPVVGLLCAGGIWLLALLLPALAISIPGRVPIAVLLVLIGLCFDATGILAFLKDKTTINPMKPSKSSALVTGAVYRFSRNPMYVGMLFILTGWAVYQNHALAWLPLPAFVAYINRFQIRPEEKILLDRFGSDYADYKASVRRWL